MPLLATRPHEAEQPVHQAPCIGRAQAASGLGSRDVDIEMQRLPHSTPGRKAEVDWRHGIFVPSAPEPLAHARFRRGVSPACYW